MAPGSNKLQLGDIVPDFRAESTKGEIQFHQWMRGHWVLLFCYPRDFSPVCATELAALAATRETFRDMGFKVAALAAGTAQEHADFEKDVVAQMNGEVSALDFPLIADPAMEIARQLGEVDAAGGHAAGPALAPAAGGGGGAAGMARHTVLIVGADTRLKVAMSLADAVGHNVREVVRVCNALLLSARAGVSTPASWPDNHANLVINGHSLEGAVFVASTLPDEEAAKRFPDHVALPVPSGRTYMRLTHVRPETTPRCWAGLGGWLAGLCGGGAGGPAGDGGLPPEAAAAAAAAAAGAQSGAGLPGLPAELPRYSTPDMARLVAVGAEAQQKGPSEGTARYLALLRASSTDGVLRVGDEVPDFTADTTLGRMSFHRWIEGKWALLTSHPSAFTPVCTTEIGTLAMMHGAFRAKGFRVAAFSTNRVEDQLMWQKDIVAHFGQRVRIGFPVISDTSREVANKFNLVPPTEASETTTSSPMKVKSRAVFIIGPDRRLRMSMCYPASVGFDVHEIMRACDALQLSERESAAVPAGWPFNHAGLKGRQGEDMEGSVFLLPTVTDKEAKRFFPDRLEIEVPSGKNYLRLVTISKKGRMPLCSNCISSCNV